MKTYLRPRRLNEGIWWDVAWNPWIGCTPIGAACDNCWACREERTRFDHLDRCRVLASEFECYDSTTPVYVHGDFWRGPVYQRNADGSPAINDPAHWRRPRVVAVCLRSDLFHEDIPDDKIERAFQTMEQAMQHVYIIPTKRWRRASSFIRARKHWMVNGPPIWLLGSVWDQPSLYKAIDQLVTIRPPVRIGLSYEPALCGMSPQFIPDGLPCQVCGSDEHQAMECDRVHQRIGWVIAGGESGPKARPSHPAWFRKVRDQCQAVGMPFLFKQWGEWRPIDGDPHEYGNGIIPVDIEGKDCSGYDALIDEETCRMQRVGKKAAGRMLDGREHNGWPGDGA